ncbi:MAG: hypothetical protein COW01_08505 [Bdellovibrionales bacterium CG12_big_fil_rev_8_21_14_0_65_38_15]|nr:MAG: hypothetical protein COW01_08505 [Bdellovibrionales bacterium CG12_big_fil_rev_8_21_14_0_65_38_15]PIR29218.1 MAG: hypothetical protein COV38_11820 [Bdellovibrionales bacterium CG11_big_fil_rev_8_21_14_0_20_38_13]
MFYLSHFFQIVRQFPVRFLVLLICTVVLFFSASHRSVITDISGLNKTQQVFHPYFHALISSKQNIPWISRKLKELPGVEKVEILENDKLNQQVQSLLAGMDGEIAQAVGELSLAGVKVVTRSELEERSITLIKDYLTRLSGNDTTIGATVFPPKKKTQNALSWQAWFSEVVVAISFILWSLSVYAFSKPIKKSSYLVEQFQRRRKVAFKTWSAAILLLASLGLASTFLMKKPDMISLAICFIVAMSSSLMYSRKTSWEG